MLSVDKRFTIAFKRLKPLTLLTQSEVKLKTDLADPAVNLITVLRLPWFDSVRTALGCLRLLPGILKILNVDVF